jgi:hypothetical protein
MIQELIKRAFNQNTPTIEEKENIYIPKIQSTVTPEKTSYNEVFQNIHNELQKKYETL